MNVTRRQTSHMPVPSHLVGCLQVPDEPCRFEQRCRSTTAKEPIPYRLQCAWVSGQSDGGRFVSLGGVGKHFDDHGRIQQRILVFIQEALLTVAGFVTGPTVT